MVAFVLGGENSVGYIVGTIIVPGNAHNHSPYRSELTGIYAIMIMVQNYANTVTFCLGRLDLLVMASRL
jgi:hypothetical protein